MLECPEPVPAAGLLLLCGAPHYLSLLGSVHVPCGFLTSLYHK